MENHRRVFNVVAKYGPDWKDSLPAICDELDEVQARHPDEWGGWKEALDAGKRERVIKAIQYRLQMVKKQNR